jgi:hypothetical protein
LGGVWELGIPLDDEVMEILDKPDVYEHVWDDDSGATTTHASDSEDADDECESWLPGRARARPGMTRMAPTRPTGLC